MLGKIAAESGVGQEERRDLSGVEAEKYGARESTRSVWIGEMRFMLPRRSVVENEVGFRQG